MLTRNSCCANPGLGWREEAAAVIHDIRDCVNQAAVSQLLPCDESHVFLNIETKECDKITVEMSTAGFRICGQSYDSMESDSGKRYETIYALLDERSPGYRTSFAAALTEKLSPLSRQQQKRADTS